jgi:hypothetical protein
MENLEEIVPSSLAIAITLTYRYSHFIWIGDGQAVTCMSDPRCVTPEHYVAPEGGEDLGPETPSSERGNIPIWRLNVLDYVSHEAFPLVVSKYCR